jgi:hypothetical protein
VEQVGVLNGNAAGGAYYSVTGQGRSPTRRERASRKPRQLAWLDRQGKAIGAASELTQYTMLKVSPTDASGDDATRLGRFGGHIWVTDSPRYQHQIDPGRHPQRFAAGVVA